MKKKTVTVSFVAVTAIRINTKIVKEDSSFNLLIDRIEASANAAGETTASWRCIGSSKNAKQHVGNVEQMLVVKEA